MFGSRIKHPRTDSPLKNNQGTNLEDCNTCSEKATKDVLECWWYESCQHSVCLKISLDQYSAVLISMVQ